MLPLHPPRCSQLNQKPSQCANVFQRNVQVFANTTSLLTDTLLSPHLDEGKVNETCRSVVTAWECYYSYPPCHSARGVLLEMANTVIEWFCFALLEYVRYAHQAYCALKIVLIGCLEREA